MTILPSNIRLLESERMTDTSDGGGRRTSRVIPDGVAGNIFPKVSRVDSVYGRVNLRKIYPHINTPTLDVYAGAHFIITDAPDNDRIGVLAFSTGSDFDLRTAARDRIESYVIAGPESRMTLYGRQLKDSQAIMVYQREEEPLPDVGDVFAISNEVGGVTTAQQFVRVQDVSHEVRTFTDDGGDFRRRVVTLKIGARMRYEFQGLAAPSRYAAASASAMGRLRSTTVADAARYYGIQPLTAAVSSGALELSVASVYAPIVPTTQRETALSLASISGAQFSETCGSGAYALNFSAPGGIAMLRLPRGIKPGTLNGSVEALLVTSGIWTFNDAGDGTFVVRRGGAVDAGVQITADYETGVLSFRNTQGYVSWALALPAVTWAVNVSQPAHTQAIPVTLASRGTVYSVPLLPLPSPGTLIVDYRALGKWYRLRDDGAGELVGGDAAYGTGTIDYVTGSATITLGALPDVGSSVLLSWGSPVHYELLSVLPASEIVLQLSAFPVRKTSLMMQWTVSGAAKSATDNGSGVITGDAAGTIDYQTGRISLAAAPGVAGEFAIAFDQTNAPTESVTPSLGGAVLSSTVYVSDIYLSFPDGAVSIDPLVARDNGSGQLLLVNHYAESIRVSDGRHIPWAIPPAQQVGVVDYATGVITMGATVPCEVYNYASKSWVRETGVAAVQSAGLKYGGVKTTVPPVADPKTQSVTVGPSGSGLSLQLSPLKPLEVVPGSLLFTAFGKDHIDRNGTIYTDVSYATGSGLAVGSINYATGAITLNDYPSATAANFAIRAALGRRGDYTATDVAFRTAGSPLRPASLYVQCTATDGDLLVGTADQNGAITGGMMGVVEQTMGVVNVEFAKPVLPGTLRYSTVVLSNLPLDADILGLDPVRLPSDGRVPIFRPADVAVVHHTDIFNAGTPTAGSAINVGRTDLSALWLEDANKKKLDSAMYSVDLAAGTATMAADMSLAGYAPPIAAKHRIEEMGLLSDVQINGQVTLTAPLLRDFPAGSQLSSALLYGDLQARATNLFDQQTWTNVWQSSVAGSGATAQYNDVDYPVEVLNNAAITERWRLNFTTTTSYQVIGENTGVIATGTTGIDLQPVNQLTGLPYFTLRAAGWGTGWAVGNQLRFDTIAAAPPTWLVRTTLPGAALTGDSFDAQLRGDVD